MEFKIEIRENGSRDLVATQLWTLKSLITASRYHGDFWNTQFAWTDRYYSTLYALDNHSLRWQKAETIN